MVANVRNRIEHRRSDFPEQDEIDRAVHSMTHVISVLEDSGLLPLLYRFERSNCDKYGRQETIYSNYKGGEVSSLGSAAAMMAGVPSGVGPKVFAPWMHVGEGREVARFLWMEPSEYGTMWEAFKSRSAVVAARDSAVDDSSCALQGEGQGVDGSF
jgi:hypothetical protein